MEVFRLVNSSKQDEFELIERILPENRILFEDLRTISGSVFHVSCFEEEIDEVRKWEQTSSTCSDHNFSWFSYLKLQAESLGLAEGEGLMAEMGLPDLG